MIYWLLRVNANVCRECVLQVNNETEYHLARPRQFMRTGALQHEPEPIPPVSGTRMIIQNDRRYLRGFIGVCGYLSWDILAPATDAGGLPSCTCARLFVFWNVPGPAGDRNLLGKVYRAIQCVFYALRVAGKGPEDQPSGWNVQIYPANTTPLVTLESLAAKALPAGDEAASRIDLSHNKVHLTAHVRSIPRAAKRGNFSLEIRLKQSQAASTPWIPPVSDPFEKLPQAPLRSLTLPSSGTLTTEILTAPVVPESVENLNSAPSSAHELNAAHIVQPSCNPSTPASPSSIPQVSVLPAATSAIDSMKGFANSQQPAAAASAIQPMHSPPKSVQHSSSNSSDSSMSDTMGGSQGESMHTSKLSPADLAEECSPRADVAFPIIGAPHAAPLVDAAVVTGNSSDSLSGAAQPLAMFGITGVKAGENISQGQSNHAQLEAIQPNNVYKTHSNAPLKSPSNSLPVAASVLEDQASTNAALQKPNPAAAMTVPAPADLEWSRSISLRGAMQDAAVHNALSAPQQDKQSRPNQPQHSAFRLSPGGSMNESHLPLVDAESRTARRLQLEAALTEGCRRYRAPRLIPVGDANGSPGRIPCVLCLPEGLRAEGAGMPERVSPRGPQSSDAESISVVVSLPTHGSRAHSSDEDTTTRDAYWSKP
jgi:hypothetical protein